MVRQVLKKELRLHNCGFSHDPVDSLVRSQWQSTSKNVFYLIYRWLVAIFVVAVVGIALEAHPRKHSVGIFFIYFTRWGITINMIVGVYGAVLVTIWHFHTDYQAYIKRIDTANILSHAMNSVIMFIDILIVAYPMRLYHIIQPLCFAACYGVFSYIYYVCGGVNEFGNHFIYPVLNWETPEKALTTTVGIFILLVIVHMALFCVYKLRVFTQRWLFTTEFVLPTTKNQATERTERINQ
ncbi:protein rolling stone-like [Sitodiplosis mosellana]|uniref:protein rolling stone-like n=1 Tax=Sitodiplosis mosellana TaxID=263140 RepID=UPI002444B877|nr:protein rolling stone-like [Sitodiplosis mosellana]